MDDNQELRQYLVSGLSSDFNLLEADNGQKALDILKGQEVDLVITDVMMPVMDGVKLCKAIKQIYELAIFLYICCRQRLIQNISWKGFKLEQMTIFLSLSLCRS